MTTVDYPAGTLVTARGRDWLVLPGSPEGTLLVRPLGGRERRNHRAAARARRLRGSHVRTHRRSTTAVTPPGPACFATRSGCRSAPAAARSAPSHTWLSRPATTNWFR